MVIEKNFHVQKSVGGASYRIRDPLGLPAKKANEFMEHLEIRGRSPYTLHSYAVGLADFLGWLHQANIALNDVTRHVAGQYITDFSNGPKGGFAGTARAGSKRQPRTVNHRLSVLTSYFAFLIRVRVLGSSAPTRYRLRSLAAVMGWQAAMRRFVGGHRSSGDECRGGFLPRSIPPPL